MIAPNSISYGVYLLCASDSNLVANSGNFLTPANPFNVGWCGPIAEDPALYPFIQVHQTKHEAYPYVLGKPQYMENKFEIRLFHGDTSYLGNSGDAFRRVWDTAYYLAHSLFSAPGNVALSGLVAPGVSVSLQRVTSELWDFDEKNDQLLVQNLLTLHFTAHG